MYAIRSYYESQMRRLGIGGDSKVVVYAHHLDNKDLLRATYVLV